MSYEYEQLLTLGPAPFVHAGTNEDFEGIEYELPRPEGDDWQLLWVMPHPSNNKIQQYFWQRRLDFDDDGDSLIEGLSPGTVTLSHE